MTSLYLLVTYSGVPSELRFKSDEFLYLYIEVQKMLNKIEKYMLANKIMPQKGVLVGLSGGADSVALTHILFVLGQKYGFRVFAAHVNHGLRGEAADRDEKFSAEFAASLGIKFFLHRADVRGIAQKEHISEEMAGRHIRYSFFEEIIDDSKIDCCATAHHRNDNAETILMNFVRGSGINGMCGIPVRRGRFIRPLLCLSRSEIESYCEKNGLDFVTDETNNETVYTRNKIRHNIIPLIEKELNPSFCDTVTNNVRVISGDVDFLENCAFEKYSALVKDNRILTKELSGLPQALSLRIIRRMIADNISMSDISSDIIFSVLELAENNRTGAICNISGDLYARIEYGYLVIEREKAECEDFCYILKMGEEKYIPQTGYTIRIEQADRQLNDGAMYFTLPDNECEIKLRNRRKGDRFVPSGMNGTKSVKDFMINEKIPKPMRSRVGIVTFNQEIGWIVGYRRDNRFKFKGNGIKIWISY